MKQAPSESQLQVLQSRDAVLLVTGGPGSGKTATALWAAHEVILTGEIGPSQHVLFLSFSRSAVNQIASRTPGVVAGAESCVEIFTFHGLAYRLLRGFGRYAGLGLRPPTIQSEAAMKLFGPQAGMIRYDDLVPAALEILKHPVIWNLVKRRWPVVISDEFQDTGEDQWRLVLKLGEAGRLILLADPDQMIHDCRPDVGAHRLAEARKLANREIRLEERSYRDPTGTIPALARAVLNRRFDDEAVQYVVQNRRLLVKQASLDHQIPQLVAEQVFLLRANGCRTVGVFGFTNDGSALLAGQLTALGVSNAIIGVPESHGEGIAAMAVLAGHAAGLATLEEAKLALATFLTACTRGKKAPDLALALIGRRPLPRGLDQRLAQMSTALRASADGTVGEVLQTIRRTWSALIAGSGSRLWLRAFTNFAGFAEDLADRPATAANVKLLLERCQRGQASGLIGDIDETRTRAVQLMNFHQTKGREADGVILVFRTDDFYARWQDREPYPERSRLLYVAISRAGSRVIVILPPQPHALVSPFQAFAS